MTRWVSYITFNNENLNNQRYGIWMAYINGYICLCITKLTLPPNPIVMFHTLGDSQNIFKFVALSLHNSATSNKINITSQSYSHVSHTHGDSQNIFKFVALSLHNSATSKYIWLLWLKTAEDVRPFSLWYLLEMKSVQECRVGWDNSVFIFETNFECRPFSSFHFSTWPPLPMLPSPCLHYNSFRMRFSLFRYFYLVCLFQ
jgi:hypothetical protein